MTNTDTRLAAYKARLMRLEEERRENAEDRKELRKEMLGAGVSKTEVAGVLLAVKREFESADRKAARTAAEAIAEALGSFADMPLAQAAIERS